MRNYREVTVLVIEDNEVDVEAIRRAFRKHKIANPLRFAGDGVAGLEALRADPDAENGVPRPCVVLLDLNMPRMSGIEFLKELRADPDLRRTVVFVLTTSSSEEDMIQSYELNVAGYALKGEVGKEFQRLVSMLDSYWRVVELPVGGAPLED